MIFSLAAASLLYFAFNIIHRGGDVALSFDMPESVIIGSPTEVTVVLQNNSRDVLRDVSVALVLPSGVSFVDDGTSSRRTEEKGFIDSGETVKETFKIIVSGNLSESRELRAEALYMPANLGQKLLTSKVQKMAVKNPISLIISAPEVVLSGETFKWGATLKNESDREWRVFLRADLPEGITGDLPAEAIVIPSGEEEKLAFSGESLLEEGAEEKVTVKILSGNEDSSPAYVITEESFVLRAAKSALGISARINGEANIVASPGGELQYAVTIRNNTGTPLSDIAASASINGKMFDFRSLSSSGRISSGGAKIIWDSGTTKELSRLDPGFEARLFFTIRVRDDFPIRNFNDKNFVLGADIKAEASGGSAGKAVSIARIRTKVSGKLDLSQKLLYRDADSGFVDDGPLPPRVGEPTEYIVRWKLSDYGSDMDNIVVSATLGRGVRLTGEKKVFVGELTEKDGVVQWRLSKLFAGTGVLSGPPEAIFQVSFTPTPGDAGVEGIVVEETSVIADDSYAGVRFEDLLPQLTTGLRDDATVKLGEGIVTR